MGRLLRSVALGPVSSVPLSMSSVRILKTARPFIGVPADRRRASRGLPTSAADRCFQPSQAWRCLASFGSWKVGSIGRE